MSIDLIFEQYGNTFVADDRQLLIRSLALGMKMEKKLWFRDIFPTPIPVRRGLLFFVTMVAIGLAPMLLALSYVSIEDEHNFGLYYLLSFWPCTLVFGAFMSIRKLCAYRFVDDGGALLFEIHIVKGKRLAAEEFVEQLSARIADLRAFHEKPNQSKDPTLASGATVAGHQSRHP
jgi:hypothetical protein